MNDFTKIYSETKDNLNSLIEDMNIPYVSCVDDLVVYYNDFYVSQKKVDLESENRKNHFTLFGILKEPQKTEKKQRNISIYYFSKKTEKVLLEKYSEDYIVKHKLKYQLFCECFRNFKRFDDIIKGNENTEKIIDQLRG